MYGQKWTSQFTDDQVLVDVQRIWSHHLAGCSGDDIKRALEQLPKHHPTWPPTVGEFLAVCNIGKGHPPVVKALPETPKTSRKAALGNLDLMMKALGKA
jgi:hypothetical protein